MLVSLDGDANSLVDAVLGVNVDHTCVFALRFDATVFRHSCDLRVCGRKHPVHLHSYFYIFHSSICL